MPGPQKSTRLKLDGLIITLEEFKQPDTDEPRVEIYISRGVLTHHYPDPSDTIIELVVALFKQQKLIEKLKGEM